MVSLPEYQFLIELSKVEEYKAQHDKLYDAVVDLNNGEIDLHVDDVVTMCDEIALKTAQVAYAKAVKDVCRLAKSGVDITLLSAD